MEQLIEFAPAEVPHPGLRNAATEYLRARLPTFSARSGASRTRKALREFTAAVEANALTPETLPPNFIAEQVLTRLSPDPVSRKMVVGEIRRFVEAARASGQDIAAIDFPTVDTSAAAAAAKERARVARIVAREARTAPPLSAPPAPQEQPMAAEQPESEESNIVSLPYTNGSAASASGGIVASAPAREPAAAPTAKRAAAKSPVAPLFPSGHRLFIWKLAGAGQEPAFIDDFPVELIEESGGTVETFLGRVVRPQYGPFPGEPQQKYRVEVRNHRKQVLNHWDLPIAAPKLPPVAGSAVAAGGSYQVQGGQPTTLTEALQTLDAIQRRIEERAGALAPAAEAPKQIGPTATETDIQKDLAELRGAVTALLQREERPAAPVVSPLQREKELNSDNILGRLAETAFTRLAEQQQRPVPAPAPAPPVADPMVQTMKMMEGMLALISPLLPKPKEQNEELSALIDMVEELKEELKETKRRNPMTEFMEMANFAEKLRETSLFRGGEKPSFLDALRPVMEKVAENAPAMIEAYGQEKARQNAAQFQLMQQQQLAARRGLPGTAPAPVVTQANVPAPPAAEAPQLAAPPAPPIVPPVPVTATVPPPRTMSPAEVAVRRAVLPAEIREAIETLLTADEDEGIEGAIKSLIERFWEQKEKDDEEAKQQQAAGLKPKPSPVGVILEGLQAKLEHAAKVEELAAEAEEAAEKAKTKAAKAKTAKALEAAEAEVTLAAADLTQNLRNIFAHVGYGAEATQERVARISERFIDMSGRHDEDEESDEADGDADEKNPEGKEQAS